jgi:hypothetical protein
LFYGANVIILVEIGEPSWRILYPIEDNEQLLMENLDLVDEVIDAARIKV